MSLALSMPPCLVHVTSLQKSGTPALRLTLHDSHRCILRTQNSGASIPFAAVKYGPRAEVQPGLIFVMDRTVGNLLEQTPPFLLGLWLHAMAASPEVAARLGWWWLMLRASYPIAFAYPSMSPRLWGLQRRLGIRLCGQRPQSGFGPFALQHDPPASGSSSGRPQASDGLGQLGRHLWPTRRHTGLVFHNRHQLGILRHLPVVHRGMEPAVRCGRALLVTPYTLL